MGRLSERLEPGLRTRTIGVTVLFYFQRMWNACPRRSVGRHSCSLGVVAYLLDVASHGGRCSSCRRRSDQSRWAVRKPPLEGSSEGRPYWAASVRRVWICDRHPWSASHCGACSPSPPFHSVASWLASGIARARTISALSSRVPCSKDSRRPQPAHHRPLTSIIRPESPTR